MTLQGPVGRHPGKVHPVAARALVLGDPGQLAWGRLAALGRDAVCAGIRDAGDDFRAGAEVVLAWDFRSHELESAWPALASLRWVHTASAGVDHVLFPALRSSDVLVTNSKGVYSRAIAEYVLGLILLDAKGFAGTVEAQRAHRWSYRETESVAGRTLVTVGHGDIGRSVARVARAAGLRVVGLRRTDRPAEEIDGVPVHPSRDLLEVLRSADYVVVCAALTPETHGLIDARALNAMKPSAYLINVARGPIVDVRAIVASLRAGRLRGAALDTFDREPLPEQDHLWDVPGLLVSPHMAGDVRDWQERVVDLFATNLARYRAGEPLLNVVDKERGY